MTANKPEIDLYEILKLINKYKVVIKAIAIYREITGVGTKQAFYQKLKKQRKILTKEVINGKINFVLNDLKNK